MVKQAKIYAVKDLTESLKDAKATALIDYQGLSADQISELRREIKKTGGVMQVAKNTLISRALANVDLKLDQPLSGPTAIVFANQKGIAPLKIVAQTAEDLGNPKFKFGILDNEFLPLEKLQKLANLPNKEVLISRLVNVLNAPLVKLVNVLQFNQRKLVLVLKSINEQESKKA